MDYIDNIKAARQNRGISQEQMASILNTTQPQYNKYERRVQELPIRHLITICKVLNVSADEILETPKGYANRVMLDELQHKVAYYEQKFAEMEKRLELLRIDKI